MKKVLLAPLLVAAICHVASVQAVEPRELLEVVDFSRPVLSPDGKKVAFRTEQASVGRNTYDASWYVQDVDASSPPRRVADGGFVMRDIAGVSSPVDVAWSPDGRWIYYRASLEGRVDVWRAAADGSGATALTHDPADVRAFRITNGGSALQYSVGATRAEIRDAEQAEYDAGIRIDKAVPLGQGLFRSGAIEGRAATQRYLKGTLARGPLLADTPARWKELDLSTGARRPIPMRGAAEQVGAGSKSASAAWKQARSPTGWVATLIRTGVQGDLLQRPDVVLSAHGPGGSKEITCSAPRCTGKQITGIEWRPHHNEVLFTVTDPGAGLAQAIYRWDVLTRHVYPVVRTHGLVNGGRMQSSPCGVSGAVLVCVTAETTQPPRLERIGIDSGQRRVLFNPNAALAQEIARSPPVRLLRWKGRGGHVFTGQFYPAQKQPGSRAPLFVSYYQCTGFVRGGVGDEYPFASLAADGISALCINQAPYERNAVHRYNRGLEAVESAVRLLHEGGEIDCTKVGMGGLSFGSEVTMWTAMRTQLLAATSVSSPSLSSTYYLFNAFAGAGLTRVLKKNWGLGSPGKTPARWHRLSPQYNLDRIHAPLLLQMSEQEYLFALDYALPLSEERLADLYVFPDEPHQKFQPKHKLAVYQRNVDWFRFWLQGFEDDAPSKASQYRHWRSMQKKLARAGGSGPQACVRLSRH